jgi:3-hydroxymyristoyl/3-hydroxydecanoyl-(acyl carrier protein) dehydratase
MQPASDHFAAYSFVDRIVEFESGRHARGTFAIPAALPAFSSALVAEAVGQLAAWTAMDHIAFRGRPVAALATDTRFHAEARPGTTLELQADLFACDDDAVAYNGRASVDGVMVVELVDCLGPMLPVADFDAPEAMRERLALLRDGGAEPARFHGIEPMPVQIDQRQAGVEIIASFVVPARARFFADHFPRRPVFPARRRARAGIPGNGRGNAPGGAHDAREDALVHRPISASADHRLVVAGQRRHGQGDAVRVDGRANRRERATRACPRSD